MTFARLDTPVPADAFGLPPDEDVVEFLEGLLARARRGAFTAVAVVTSRGGDDGGNHISAEWVAEGDDAAALVLGTAALRVGLLAVTSEDDGG